MAILKFQNIAIGYYPQLSHTHLILYIKPPPIYVYTVPDVVGADDTADVIIKHRLHDGTLEDFPPEQTFELAVLDGCVNGNFMVGDSINVYFEDALQPVKFVTADSLESDSGYVRLRVGTDVEGFMRPISNIKGEAEKHFTESKREPVGNTGYTLTELRAGFEKMMEKEETERLAEKIKTGGEPSPEVPIIEACALDQSSHPFYWEGNALVMDGVCNKLQKCTTNNGGIKPKIEVIDLPNGYGGTRDYCLEELGLEYEKNTLLAGYFTPVYRESLFEKLWENYDGERMFYDYQLDLCYDEYANVIQFGIIGDKLLLKSIVGYCGDNLPPSIIKINNLEDLRTKIPQDISSLTQAIDEIKKLRTYKGGGTYHIEELTWAHELKHLSNYQEQIVNRVNIDSDLLNYSKFDVICSGQSNLNDVKDEMKENFDKKLLEFEDKLAIKQYEKWGSKSSSKESDKIKNDWNETTNTHDTEDVQNVIQKYIDEILIIIAEIHFGEIIIKP